MGMHNRALPNVSCAIIAARSNKGMKLTKLSAAPTLAPQAALGRRCRRMPAPSTAARGHRFAAYPRCSTPAVGRHNEPAAAPGVGTAHELSRGWTGCAASLVTNPPSSRFSRSWRVARLKWHRARSVVTDDRACVWPRRGAASLKSSTSRSIKRRSHAELTAERCAVPRPPWSRW